MTTLPVVLTILAGLMTLVWATRHLKITIERKRGFVLRRSPWPEDRPAPRVSMLVAAKDEQETIARCLRSLLAQDYPNFEIIVVDDRSTDKTAEIVGGVARLAENISLIRVDELPEGWCGKNHAMHLAASRATGEYLFMTDADCEMTTAYAISAAVQLAQAETIDMLSVLPTLEIGSLWEAIVQPVAGGVMMIWCEPKRVNSSRRKAAYANGAFILVRREAYEAIGGHEAIRGLFQDDLLLARRIKSSGRALRVVRSDDLIRVRMYTKLSQILRGWTRIFLGTFGTVARLVASIALLLFMTLLPYGIASVGVVGWTQGWPGAWWPVCGLAGLASVAMQLSVIYRFYHLLDARPGLFWTYPLGGLVVLLTLLRALSTKLGGKGISWRGTDYSGASVAPSASADWSEPASNSSSGEGSGSNSSV